MNGFFGRILKIDLTRQQFNIEPVADAVFTELLGGKGLASKLLFDLNPPGVDPMAPENHLIFSTGPVTASSIWGSSRYGVFTKSPQTGCYAESYAGGKVPEAMDSAGFDAIVLAGRCDTPTVLAIFCDRVEFHEAGDLWGMETYGAEDAVKERFARNDAGFNRPGAVVIGPAAENGVRFSVIKNDHWRCAGRTGVGSVMGAKQVKGILFQGDRRRPLHDPAAVRRLAKELSVESRENPGVKAYKSMGTSQMVKIMNTANAFPTGYWEKGTCDHWEKIGADALHGRCEVRPNACAKCFMACGRMTTITQGRHAGLKIEGPEYETIYAFGGLCMVDSIEEIAYLNDICDRLGMDTITAGNLCAFAMEARRLRKIDDDINPGDVDAIAGLLAKIARKEGIGAILAEGIRHAAKAWDLEDVAVHVKGMEPAGYDPRSLKGMGLAYATSDRGACHLRSTFYKPELAGMIDRDQIEGKAEMFLDFEDRLTIFDTLILCRFYRDLYPWELLEEMIHSATGLDADKATLSAKAAAISTLVRRFNLREGVTAEDDRLPRGLHRPLADSGKTITEAQLQQMVGDYYRLRGWDEAGVPLA
ncbi:MAG: aldehyde ferredoxin oxidoreductase family protein [Desulfobacterales bacterium]|nr:aldehyde ferredoxin oxidoreductase family protein [Desulfobacterales bacterium]